MKKILIALLIFTLSWKGICQINTQEYTILRSSIPSESMELFTNSNVFLAGEYLYYKTILFDHQNNRFSDISKIVYLELIGADNNIVFKHKLKIINNTASGDFFIPASIPSGHFKLVSYTNWSQNNSRNKYAQKDIFIINPFVSKDQANKGIELNQNVTKISKTDSTLLSKDTIQDFAAIKLSRSIFDSREKVDLQISFNSNLNAINTLSIRKVDPIIITNLPNKNKEPLEASEHYLPELRGEIISGYLKASNNMPIEDIAVSLSFSDTNPIFKNAVTNKKGQFFFIITDNYNNKPLSIQIQDPNKAYYKIILHDKQFNYYEELLFNNLDLNSNLKEWLESESINNQIENAYFTIKTDSILSSETSKDFYSPIQTTFNLDDYTRFKTIKETFVEIVTTASLREQDSTFVFNVPDLANIDYNRDLNHLIPLVLVDGVLIQRNSEIAYYDNAEIESVSTVTGQYIYGNNLYNGIISFKTYDGNFSSSHSKKFDYSALVPSKIYYQPNYMDNTTLKRIPDYRKQLLWIPNLNIKKEGIVSFYTSDNVGLYQITLESLLPNGESKRVIKYFTISKPDK